MSASKRNVSTERKTETLRLDSIYFFIKQKGTFLLKIVDEFGILLSKI